MGDISSLGIQLSLVVTWIHHRAVERYGARNDDNQVWH